MFKLYKQFMHYKFLKKIIGVFGYKIVDKNLIKNERLISKYNYLTLNKILSDLFNDKKIKSIIQIGSNDGVRFDNLNYFIKKHNPSVIFIEPIKTHFEKLINNYEKNEKFIFENSAISVNDEIKELFKVKDSKLKYYDEHVLGITSFDRKHLIKHGVNKNHIEKEKVNSISIKNLLKKYSVENFDLLFVDTEGYDANIIFDFLNNSKIKPIILFEYIHAQNKILEKTLEILKDRKYNIFKIEENIFSIPEEINLRNLINNPSL